MSKNATSTESSQVSSSTPDGEAEWFEWRVGHKDEPPYEIWMAAWKAARSELAPKENAAVAEVAMETPASQGAPAASSERLPLDQIEEAAINMACPVGFVTYLRGLKIADPQELRTTTASPVSDSPTPAESASSSRYALSYTPPEVFAPSQSER